MAQTREALELIVHMQRALTDLGSALQEPGSHPRQMQAMKIIEATFGALEAAVLPPGMLAFRLSFLYHIPFAMATVIDLGIPELLTEAGDRGLTSNQIETRYGLPHAKVSRLLRILTGRGVFKEVRPDVWTHSNVSEVLDSGLPYEELAKEPIKRYAKGASLPALINHCAEVGGAASNGMIAAFREEKWRKGIENTETPFNYVYKTNSPLFEWFATTEDGSEGTRMQAFAKAMQNNNARDSDFTMYPWHELGEKTTLVDIGAGVGSATRAILSEAPNIKKAHVQDLEPVIKAASDYWKAESPDDLTTGRVVLQVQSFFDPQAVKAADVYFLRYIIHDWPDQHAVKILERIYDAASHKSRLLVMDSIVDHACHDLGGLADTNVEGAHPPPIPAPIPANGGLASEYLLAMDLHMMCVLNGQDRTFVQLKNLALKAGWKAKKVYHSEFTNLKITEFIKIPLRSKL